MIKIVSFIFIIFHYFEYHFESKIINKLKHTYFNLTYKYGDKYE